jgi:hypothetical protein
MKNLPLLKEYPAWPWLLVPFRSSQPEPVHPAGLADKTARPARPVLRVATGGPVKKSRPAINWELAARAKP